MTQIRYRYVEQNRLEHRHHYHYTPYEGRDFLHAYLAQRTGWMRALQTRDSHSDADGFSSAGTPEATVAVVKHCLTRIAADSTAEPLPTRLDGWRSWDVLHSLCETTFGMGPLSARDRKRLDNLVQRFEVTKRIYAAYDLQNKPLDRQYDAPESYAVLSLICLDEYRRSNNLKYLNASLKLLDLLGSLPLNSLSSPTGELCLISARMETGFIESLMTKQGAA